MIVVLDTNVLYQALMNNEGASFYILNLIRDQKINLAISLKVFKEYEDVLKRKKSLKDFGLNTRDINFILKFIAYIGKPFDPRFLFRPNLIDEDDNKFIELAVTSNSSYLITGNTKDYKNPELKFDNFEVITPIQFYKIWRRNYE